MRDYGVVGQIGLEQSPEEYIKKLVEVFRELKRVLKDTGSFYLNLGDTYCGSACGFGASGKSKTGLQDVTDGKYVSSRQKPPMLKAVGQANWLKAKQLMLMPTRLAIALQNDGWILRNDIIWHKNNPMPCSVKDRLTNTYEHIFHFVKNKRYWYDLDAIRVPHKHGIPSKFNSNATKTDNEHRKDIEIQSKQTILTKHKIVGRNSRYKLRSGTSKHYRSFVDRVKAYRDANPAHGSNIFGNPKGKNPGDVI